VTDLSPSQAESGYRGNLGESWSAPRPSGGTWDEMSGSPQKKEFSQLVSQFNRTLILPCPCIMLGRGKQLQPKQPRCQVQELYVFLMNLKGVLTDLSRTIAPRQRPDNSLLRGSTMLSERKLESPIDMQLLRMHRAMDRLPSVVKMVVLTPCRCPQLLKTNCLWV
jgi:hypothetical protein